MVYFRKFLFFKQKTASEMRISDWSSDVCSSDLDIVHVANGRFQALLDDARLFGRDWGFRMADIKVPVRWWHGDADSIISLADAQSAVEHLRDVELRTEECRVGKECVSTCRSWWAQYH